MINLSIPSAHHFRHISREDYKIMTDFFHEGNGLVAYMRLPRQRRALRVSLAETWLTVYSRRVISDPDVNFPKFFGNFSELSNLF